MPSHRTFSRTVPGIVFALLVSIAVVRTVVNTMLRRSEVAAQGADQTRQVELQAEQVRQSEAARVTEQPGLEQGRSGQSPGAMKRSDSPSLIDRFRDIDTRPLKATDLDTLTSAELGILRNYVFARHGRTFVRQKYRDYFSQFSWYRPDANYSDRSLNAVERRNVQLIAKREGPAKGKELP